MDISIKFLPDDVDEWTVTRQIAAVLHSNDFAPRSDPDERVINFQVKLNSSQAGGVRNDGTGILTLPGPTEGLGYKFLDWVKDYPIKIMGKKIKFYKHHRPPRHDLVMTLEKTPFIDPDIEQEHQKKLWDLHESLRVNAVQFGVFYRPVYPSNDRERLSPRAFSIEWERDCVKESIAWLKFEYDHRLIRIELGNKMTEESGHSISISFSSIQKIGVGYDASAYICFDLLTPPVLEEIDFHRTTTGDGHVDNRKFKRRVCSLHPGHEMVSPYARHLRIVLYDHPKIDMIDKFVTMCGTAGLKNIILRCGGSSTIDAYKRGFFTSKRLHQIKLDFSRLAWTVAFQLESLLRNALLHTDDIRALLSPVSRLCKQHPANNCKYVGDLLRRFGEALQARPARESPLACFARVRDTFEYTDSKPTSGNSLCCHVTFTPTRMILEGPYPTQSNRVIREYEGYDDHFIRVDFRDEDRLRYRWDREVDGSNILAKRVGSILKSGFDLAGRHFEFLAYSTSALREHAVWFMNPFEPPKKDWVTSDAIRRSLGNFEGKEIFRQPSLYAARLAQAFTATEASVEISKNQWEKVDDLGCKPYLFTDGVGTISKKLGDDIWRKLCEIRPGRRENAIQPSAYQIRFLGYKGVVGVDEHLDGSPNGILMRLRGSMGKFESHDVTKATIEIAEPFDRPKNCYLNKSLIMVLEDLEVRKEAFLELQEDAIAEVRTIHDSSQQFRAVLDGHSLGSPYHLSSLLKRLEGLGLDLNTGRHTSGIDNPFLQQLRQVAMNDVLRDIKHRARIPIPESYLLVGVADEGPAYIKAGHSNVYTLPAGHIYACIQKPGDAEPTWIKGVCTISRSPVAHPGDVQRVAAIGKPPAGQLCLFAHMKNVVVLPSVGKRSLASCLGGGDLDGDTFSVICYAPFLPAAHENAASYGKAETKTLERDCTVEDICDFVVEYINSDVLGLLSNRLLVIADQSIDGIFDKNCTWLAELCSQAVDYPKRGIPVDLDNNRLPRTLIRCNPDWQAAEVVSPRKTDYYESSRALGHLYRAITLDEPQETPPSNGFSQQILLDPISLALRQQVRSYLGPHVEANENSESWTHITKLFRRYADELRYICTTHTLTNTPGIRLLEAEVVIGTILAKCSQKRWREDRIHRMRLHATTLVRDTQRAFLENPEGASVEELRVGLERAWKAWEYSLRLRCQNEFGAHSFGLIALGVIFDCLDQLPPVLL